MREDFGVWNTEDGDGGCLLLDLVLEVPLVEDVSFSVLDDENYTTVMDSFGFFVGFKCCFHSCC